MNSVKDWRIGMSMHVRKGQCWKVLGIAAVALVGLVAPTAAAVPLNTGYNHIGNTVYPTTGGTIDNYWIRIASYLPPALTQPVTPAFVLSNVGTPWLPPMPLTNWIGPKTTPASAPGASQANPAYAIFRKCFCLLPNFKNAKLDFTLRADDTVQVWLNTQLNQLVPPSWGNWSWGQPLAGATSNQGQFRVGRNCLYVLVEDFGGHMGFDLLGSVDAVGLLPTPAAGVDQRFLPCPCEQGPAGTSLPNARQSSPQASVSDDEVVREIVKIAEARRGRRERNGYRGTPPPANP